MAEGWIDRERDKLARALFGKDAKDLSVSALMPIFNFQAALERMVERGCACNGDTFDSHQETCLVGKNSHE